MIRLESMTGCPRAQRIRIHLERKGLAYEHRRNDQTWSKPMRHDLLPLGRRPVLRHDDLVLTETTVIAEYLDDAFPDIPMFPHEPGARAAVRELIALAETRFEHALAEALSDDYGIDELTWSQTVHQAWRDVDCALARTAPMGVLAGGPMSAADAAFGPYFQRFTLLGLDQSLCRTRPSRLALALGWRDRLLDEPLLLETAPEAPGTRRDFIRIPRLEPRHAPASLALPPPSGEPVVTTANPGPGYRKHPRHKIELMASQKRVRVRFGDATIADSSRTLLLLETRYHPIYYFPPEDVDQSALVASDHDSYCPFKGTASYWSIQAGGRESKNAVWSYRAPYDEVADIRDRFAFYWDRVDHWYEEDEEIFVHVRHPHVRIDVIPSSRPVQVSVGGAVIGESNRALFLFETGLPARYYLPRDDVLMDRLTASETVTACPYKGRAQHWHYSHGGARIDDIAWSYAEPLPEASRIRDHLCFYPDRVDKLMVDGQET